MDQKNVEKLWARNKYLILSYSQKEYQYIRQEIKKDITYENCWNHMMKVSTYPEVKGEVKNAYLHLWGYFKKEGTTLEKNTFFYLLKEYEQDHCKKEKVLHFLKKLLQKYPHPYLIQSSIFYGDKPLKEVRNVTMTKRMDL